MKDNMPDTKALAAAPLIDNWELRRAVLSTDREQFHGIFRGHPEIPDGVRGHSSDVVQIDDADPPRWAICTSRTYRLGTHKKSGLSSPQGPVT